MFDQEHFDPEFTVVIHRLMNEAGCQSERSLAKLLQMEPNAYYNRKSKGSLPYKQIVTLCREMHISLDVLYGVTKPEGSLAAQGAVDPSLLGLIMRELEEGLSGTDAQANIEHSGQLGRLAAGIYNKLLQSPDQTRTHLEQLIRQESRVYAEAVNLLAAK